jgi:hypothetical protein
MNINSIITEWTYRLPKGYPVEVQDYDVLREILDEMTDLPVAKKENIVRQAQGITEQAEEDNIPLHNTNPNSVQDDIADLLDNIKTQTKQQQLESFANYTAKHYPQAWITKLSGTSGIFNVTDIIDNEQFGVDIKSYRNAGTAIEAVLFEYITQITGEQINHVDLPGQDGVSGNSIFEVKSTEKSSFSIQLQTTFFSNDPTKYCLFVIRDGSGYNFDNFKVYVVSSQLLRKLSLGNEIYNDIEKSGTSELLKKQIKDGLQTLNFDEQLASVITSGETGEYEKQFRIGNNVSVRFLISIEPKKF